MNVNNGTFWKRKAGKQRGPTKVTAVFNAKTSRLETHESDYKIFIRIRYNQMVTYMAKDVFLDEYEPLGAKHEDD